MTVINTAELERIARKAWGMWNTEQFDNIDPRVQAAVVEAARLTYLQVTS